jgi:hypothetical protein
MPPSRPWLELGERAHVRLVHPLLADQEESPASPAMSRFFQTVRASAEAFRATVSTSLLGNGFQDDTAAARGGSRSGSLSRSKSMVRTSRMGASVSGACPEAVVQKHISAMSELQRTRTACDAMACPHPEGHVDDIQEHEQGADGQAAGVAAALRHPPQGLAVRA